VALLAPRTQWLQLGTPTDQRRSNGTIGEEHMNTEDDEFNRIEREAVARKMSVAYNLEMQRLREELPTGIPFVTHEELEQLLKDET